MFLKRNYILHTESGSDISQWHFTNAKILGLVCVSLIVLGSFLVIGADYVSKILYDKRLKEFKSNYASVVDNIDEIQKCVGMSGLCGVKIFLGSSTGSLLLNDEKVILECFKKIPTMFSIHSEDEEIMKENFSKLPVRPA